MPDNVPFKSTRITQLDGLRGLAIVMVFLHHAYHVQLLWMGVDIFFVLSGFLITGILFNHKDQNFSTYIGHFYARRIRRIFPPYIVLLVISAALMGTYWLRQWYFYLGTMNFNPLPPASLSLLWSLAVEEQFYLVWPIAVFFLNRRHLILCAVGLIVAAPILRFVGTPLVPGHTVYFWLPFRMDTLAAGALVALTWPSLQIRLQASLTLRRTLSTAAGVAVCVALAALWLLGRYGYTTYSNTPFGNAAIFEATLVIGLSVFLLTMMGVAKPLFDFAPLRWIGLISYSIYLIHMTFLEVLLKERPVLSAAASIAYATLLWFLVEKPLIGGGKRKERVLLPQAAPAP